MEEISKTIKVIKILKQVMHGIKQNFKNKFKDMNLTGPQGILLGTLSHFGEMKISDLSKRLGLSNSTVSGIIDRLENQGLVERIRSKEDRRVVYVDVTPEFRKNARESFNEVERMFEVILNKATPQELDTIFEGLDTLKRLMEQEKE